MMRIYKYSNFYVCPAKFCQYNVKGLLLYFRGYWFQRKIFMKVIPKLLKMRFAMPKLYIIM